MRIAKNLYQVSSIMYQVSRKMDKRPAVAKAKARQGGQVMLLTVVMLTGIILSITSLVALIVLYQLRQTTDVIASHKAIFAADAGIECRLYARNGGTSSEWGDCATGRLSNGAEFKTVSNEGSIKSAGRAGRSARAFEITF